jgi:hypothetical protein
VGVAPKHKKSFDPGDPFKIQRVARVPSPPNIFKRGSVPAELHQAAAEALASSGPEGHQPAAGELALLTKPEWYTYWVLTTKLHKRNKVDFLIRVPVGFGGGKTGKTQLDFLFIDGTNLAFEIQGGHFHLELGTQKIVEDLLRREELALQGIRVMFMEEDRLVADSSGKAAEVIVRDALRGFEHTYYQDSYFVGRVD